MAPINHRIGSTSFAVDRYYESIDRLKRRVDGKYPCRCGLRKKACGSGGHKPLRNEGRIMTEERIMDAVHDVDPLETGEWLDAIQAVIEAEGVDRAHFLLENLITKARERGARSVPDTALSASWFGGEGMPSAGSRAAFNPHF
jgi:hypothetical protein